MSSVEKIEKLFELQKKGIITAGEFKQCKEKLLNTEENTQSLKGEFEQLKKRYHSFWMKTFSWKGRATVEEFWEPIIVNQLIFSCLRMLNQEASYLFVLIAFFPFLSVLVRRLHDLGKSGKYILIPFLVFILFIAGLVFSTSSVVFSGFKLGVWSIQILSGIGLIWALCALMNRMWFFTARPSEPKANQYGDFDM